MLQNGTTRTTTLMLLLRNSLLPPQLPKMVTYTFQLSLLSTPQFTRHALAAPSKMETNSRILTTGSPTIKFSQAVVVLLQPLELVTSSTTISTLDQLS